MNFFPKPADDLVFDLINKANPLLPIPLHAGIVRLEPPKAIADAGPTDLNTTVKVSANRGQGYRGTRNLSYRRINLASFFKDTTVIVNKYKNNSQPVKFSDYLDDFNSRYGFNMTSDDFIDAGFSGSVLDPADGRYTATANVVMKADSHAFLGSFIFRWKNAPQELKNVITKLEIPGRTYPSFNFVNMLTYGGDNTAMLSTRSDAPQYTYFDYFSEGLLFGGLSRPDLLSTHKQIVDVINQDYGTAFFIDSAKGMDVPNNLFNTVASLVTLPSALYPSANSKDFKRLLVLKLQPAHSWGTGDLFFHHNYGV